MWTCGWLIHTCLLSVLLPAGFCLGFLFANSLALDTKLDAAAVMSIVGFGCYFLEAWLRGSGENAAVRQQERQRHTQQLASQRVRAHRGSTSGSVGGGDTGGGSAQLWRGGGGSE